MGPYNHPVGVHRMELMVGERPRMKLPPHPRSIVRAEENVRTTSKIKLVEGTAEPTVSQVPTSAIRPAPGEIRGRSIGRIASARYGFELPRSVITWSGFAGAGVTSAIAPSTS